MPDLLLQNLDSQLYQDLHWYAAEHGVSVEEEAKSILNQILERKREMEDIIREADEFARRVGPQTIDSTDIIREERERL